MSELTRAREGWHQLLARLRPEIMRDAVADALRKCANNYIAEAEAEISRLMAEVDLREANHNTIMAPLVHAEACMAVCRGEEPGTVFRTTDTHDEWLLGDDQEWHRHVAAFPTGSATALGEQAQS